MQKSRRSHRKRKETLSSQIIQICRRSHLLQIYISIVLKAAHRPLRLTASADSVWPISNLILVERKQESAALENVLVELVGASAGEPFLALPSESHQPNAKASRLLVEVGTHTGNYKTQVCLSLFKFPRLVPGGTISGLRLFDLQKNITNREINILWNDHGRGICQ